MGIFVVFLMTLFWFVLGQDHRVVLFLSHLVMVTEPPGVMLVFCVTVYVQQENIKA